MTRYYHSQKDYETTIDGIEITVDYELTFDREEIPFSYFHEPTLTDHNQSVHFNEITLWDDQGGDTGKGLTAAQRARVSFEIIDAFTGEAEEV